MASPSLLSSVRSHLDQEQLAAAEALLAPALASHPNDSALNALQAEVELYSQREPEAIRRLSLVTDPSELGQKLADFLHCRSLLAKKLGVKDDSLGALLQEELAKSGSWTASESVGIGISACLIVKNEEANLPRCLESLKRFVDEIVVVDTGSTDRTVEIAESYGAVLGSFEWCQDFSAARNASLELATKPWILWIDADEELVGGTDAMWQEALIRPQFAGYMVRIVNFLEGSDERTEFVHTPVRLFQNNRAYRFEGRIHEQISTSIVGNGGRIATLSSVTLNHYGYLPDMMQDRNKVQRTLEMLSRELEEAPNHPFHLFNLAMTYSVAQDFVACEKAAAKAASALGPNELIGDNVYHLWALALLSQERYAEVCSVTQKSEEAGYHSVLIEYERAQALFYQNSLEAALKSVRRCIGMAWPERLTGDTSVATVKRHLLHCRILLALDRGEDALAALEPATETVDKRGLRGAALFKLERWREASELFETMFDHAVKGQSAKIYAAQCQFELEHFDQTIALCRERSDAGAKDEEGFMLWVRAAERGGDSNQILEAYAAYTASCPPIAETLINWGRAFQASDQYDRALACYSEAHKADPSDPNALLNAGDVLYLMASYLDAAHFYEQALQLDVENPQAWFVMGNCLLQMGALDGARGAYDQCILRKPDHEAAIHNKGLIAEIQAGNLAA